MNFLAPGAFFLGLLLPVIVAFYLLKLRRVERSVSSVYLWRRVVRDVEANAPWQRLRFNLLMILQLLFLIALILAVARPFTWAEGAGGQAAIFILDSSASMSATDVTPSRLESARQRARQLVGDLPDSARVTIIEAGQEAQVRLSASLDRRQAYQALEAIRPGMGGSDMSVALELASAIAARQPGTEIFVLSDGRVELPQRLTLRGRLRYLPFGLSGENQAISLLTLEPGAAGSDLTAFAQVSNYGEEPARRRLSIFAGGRLINAFDLEIAPGGVEAALAEGLPPGTEAVEARLDGADALALDDRALAVLPQARPVRVTLVGGNNVFIKTALSLLPGVEFSQVEPSAPTGEEETAPTAEPPAEDALNAADLTIYDNQVPAALPPTGSLLFIAPPASTELFTTTGIVQGPLPRVLDLNDPILEHVTLAEINVLDAVEIPLPDWALPVIGGDLKDDKGQYVRSVPLLFRGEVDGRRVAVLAFDLHHSDLPLNVAFPLLWANLIDWLAPGARSPLPAQVAPGERVTLTPPNPALLSDAAVQATITRPDGSTAVVQPENGRLIFADTTQLGLYRIRFGSEEDELAFTVNLFAPQESNLLPADSLPGLEGPAGTGGRDSQLGQREWWRPLALLALGLLMGEWLVYQRAGLARLRDALAAGLRGITRRPAPAGAQRKGRK